MGFAYSWLLCDAYSFFHVNLWNCISICVYVCTLLFHLLLVDWYRTEMNWVLFFGCGWVVHNVTSNEYLCNGAAWLLIKKFWTKSDIEEKGIWVSSYNPFFFLPKTVCLTTEMRIFLISELLFECNLDNTILKLFSHLLKIETWLWSFLFEDFLPMSVLNSNILVP